MWGVSSPSYDLDSCFYLILRHLMSCLCLSDDRARRSPRKLPTSLKKEERKWVPPKFLPHKYDVKLKNEDKVR